MLWNSSASAKWEKDLPKTVQAFPNQFLAFAHFWSLPGFNQTFPGVRVHLLGHNAIFRIPFFRAGALDDSFQLISTWKKHPTNLQEWCLMHGHGSAGRETCLYLLRRGDSIALAPGGAKESLECEPGTMRLVLQNRKGFARLALRP